MEIELNRFTPAEQATFRLRALYEQAGYRKYRASRFEEYALYQEYQRFLPDAQVITFTDLDGKLRAIKPDVTLSIAKTAQPAAGECKRFYYNEEVCRPSRESHTFQTIHQMGLESMGAVDADEQAAVVRLALQSLAALDVPTVLEISHMGYLTGLLDALHVPAEARAKLLDFLRAKNAHELRTAALAAGLDESAAAALTGLLDRWAVWISAKPGAGIYFDTAYAAIVCLVLILLCWLAFHWRVRLRVAGPCILLAAAVSIGLGNALSRDVVHIDLVGSANAPAVVVTQNDTAVVLFRGGASAQNAVENQLARRGVQTVELVADLRTNPKTACTLEAERTLPAAEMAVNTAQKLRCTPALVEMLRTRNGCLVRLTVGNRQFAVVNGTVELAKQVTVQWLLASPAKPDAVQYKNVLALRSYDWMDNRKELAASISLRRHGGQKTE